MRSTVYLAAKFVTTTVAAFITTTANANLTISANSDVLAGQTAFQSSGNTTTQFDWGSKFAANSHQSGQLGPILNAASISVILADGTQNSILGANGETSPLALANWIDGAGFNTFTNSAVADLAISGTEAFDLVFEKGHQSVGFAIATGTGNLPSDVDLTGASFSFTAKSQNGNVLASASYSLAVGKPDQAWLTITSSQPFYSLEVRETGAVGIADQYFGNILTSESPVSNVPESGTLTLMILGLAATFAFRGRTAE